MLHACVILKPLRILGVIFQESLRILGTIFQKPLRIDAIYQSLRIGAARYSKESLRILASIFRSQ